MLDKFIDTHPVNKKKKKKKKNRFYLHSKS